MSGVVLLATLCGASWGCGAEPESGAAAARALTTAGGSDAGSGGAPTEAQLQASTEVLDSVRDGLGPEGDARGVGDAAPPTTSSSDDPADGMAEPANTTSQGQGERPVFTRPDSLRGIYLNAWSAGSSRRSEALIDLAKRTEVNAFVIDIKDATGYVSHPSALPGAEAIGATGEIRIRDLPGLLRRLEAAEIYPIARIVIVKDPLLSAARPELAVQDTAGGVWVDSKKIVWLNLYNEAVWAYHTQLAIEVAEMGFPEIQWDYVRFPDAPASDLARAVFPGDSIGPRTEAVRSFLTYAREGLRETGLDVRTTADVFGVTTNVHRDVGIGQVWETFIDRVDAALPMVYPSHYWEGSFGFASPNAHPYEIVYGAIEYAVRRTEAVDSAGAVIPWLQDFTLGAPRYEAPEVRAQIQATYDAGARDWILWNPGSSYTEDALMPSGGFDREPMMRVAGRIVPVSERFRALKAVADSIARARAPVPDTATSGLSTSTDTVRPAR